MMSRQTLSAESVRDIVLKPSNSFGSRTTKICAVMTVLAVVSLLVVVGLFVSNIDARREPQRKHPANSANARNLVLTEYTNAQGVKVVPPRGALIFEENFNVFDLDVWQHEITLGGGGNWEFQLYQNNRSNSYVKDGVLYIKPTLTSDKYGEAFLSSGEIHLTGGAPADQCTNALNWGCQRTGTPTNILNPISSARIRTLPSFAFRYGKVEARAKLPRGDWLWPAIWLMPKSNNYGGWPASGELDVMESRGNKNLINGNNVSIGVDQMGSTLHYGPDWSLNGWDKAHFDNNLEGGRSFDEDFHIFGLEWTPEYMKFSVDGEEIGTVNPTGRRGFWDLGQFGEGRENPWVYAQNTKMAPFDQQFYLIINLAVGGTNGYFPDNVRNSGREKPWKNSSPQASLDFWNDRTNWLPTWQGEDSALKVDYIRVWAL